MMMNSNYPPQGEMVEAKGVLNLISGNFKLLLFGSFITLVLVAFSSCQKTLEIYAGFPMQPKNIDSEYKPGINVFGICKSGQYLSHDNQYFEVQYLPHISDTMTDINFTDAHIVLKNNDVEYTLKHFSKGEYFNFILKFEPGERWYYECIADTFIITASTIIPNQPIIKGSIIDAAIEKLVFDIDYDASAYMYDVAYIDEYGYAQKRIVPQDGVDTEVEMEIQYNKQSEYNLVYVIAYDKNYEQYISTSNIFFKPNAYRPRYTTVKGGYGCFGSCTSLEIDLKSKFNFVYP